MDEIKPVIGTGEGESPLRGPVGNQDTMRTMGSDLKSLQETGGQTVKPYIPPSSPSQPQPEPPASKPAEPIFQPPTIDAGPVNFPPAAPPASLQPTIPAQSHKKGFVVGLIIVLAIIGLAAAGYFYVYPNFILPLLGVVAPTETLTPPPAEPGQIIEVSPVEIPPAETQPETVTPAASHNSLLKTAADSVQEISLATVDLTNLKTAINPLAATTPTFKEFTLKDDSGAFLKFGQVMNLVLPDVFDAETSTLFEENDFTVFVYSDSRDGWPGFIGKVKNTADLETAKQKIALLESSADLKNIFAQDPGAGQTWKAGQTDSVTNRYLSFTQTGAALNYGWLNNNLIITTSYNAFKEALKKL